MAKDIPERERTGDSLWTDESRLLYLFERNPIPMFVYETNDLAILAVNDAFIASYGYTRQEAVRLRLTDLHLEEQKETVVDAVRRFGDRAETREWRHRTKQRKQITVLTHSSGIVFQGQPARIVVVVDITDRLQAVRALHEREEQYQKLVALLPDALFVNVDERIVFANPACCKLLRAADQSELIGKSIFEIIHPDCHASVRERRRITLAGGASPLTEETYVRLDGSIVDVDVAAVGTDWAGARGTQVIVRDISQRKRTERELQESHERYRRLFEDHTAAKFVVDPETSAILDVNAAAVRLYGWTREELRSMALPDIAVMSPEQLRTTVAETTARGEGRLELPHRRSDGSTRDVEVFTSVVEIEGKRVLESIVHDITDRKRAEAALSESEERYRRLVLSLSDALYIQVDGRLTFVNDAMCRLLGADDPSALLGTSIFEIVHPDFHEAARERLLRAPSELPRLAVEERYLRLDGTSVDVEVTGVAVEWQGVAGVQIIARDITERKGTEAEIRRLNRIYTVLSDINQAIVRIRDQQKLFNETCRIAVEKGGFMMAWFGTVDSQARRIEVAASFGPAADYLAAIDLDLRNEKKRASPAAHAVRTASRVVVNDVAQDATMHSWREQASKRGYRSVAVFPITVAGNVRGIFSLSSEETGFFNPGELKLLDELAMDISFAIEFIEEDAERKKAEDALRMSEALLRLSMARTQNLNRTYTVLSNINQAIVRIHDMQQLFDEACRIAVEDGGFAMAWLGSVDSDSQVVRIVASHGVVGDYLHSIDIDVRAESARMGPAAKAILSGRYALSSDIERDETMLPWREDAAKMGYRSTASFPLTRAGKVWGTFSLYSSQPDFFDADEIKLLTELAMDISFAIDFIYEESERQKVEVELRRNEELLRSAVRVANIGIFEHDRLNDSVFWSPRMRDIYGVGPDEPVTINKILDHVHPDDAELAASRIDRVHGVSEDGLADTEFRIVRSDGTIRWVLTRSKTFFEGEGKSRRAVRTVGATLDVTEHREAEEQLQLSDEIIKRVNALILICDGEGRMTYVSPSVKPILGYEPEEVLGERWWVMAHPDDLGASIRRRLAGVARGDLPAAQSPYETRVRSKDGKDHWLLWQHAKGMKPELISVGQDITDRKSADEALKLSERKYKSIFESAPMGIFQVTVDGKFATCNQEMARILGYDSPEEMVGLDVAGSAHIESEQLTTLIAKVEAEESISDLAVPWKKRDGAPIWIRLNGQSVRDEKGTMLRFEGFVRDITEQKLAEERLRQIEERRRELERGLIQAQKLESLGTLASGIAHDFNNLLGVILGHASLLEANLSDSSSLSKKSLDAILRAATRGAGLVKQMLTFARKADVSFQPIVLNDVVREIVKFIRETFTKTITVETRLHPELPSIGADATQVHQVLLNLCVNARDAMPHGGRLTIATGTEEGARLREAHPDAAAERYVVVSVEDNGTGIDEEAHQRIFEPFFTTKEPGKGTGLGLSLVFGIMQAHNGFVDFRSRPEEGTTFRCYFPMSTEGAQSGDLPLQRPKSVLAGSETILVVEDEAALRGLLNEILSSQGYRVYLAEDGERGLEVFEEHRDEIALVLSDLGMPKFGGDELFRRLKQQVPGIRVLLASGFVEPSAKASLLEGGVREVISKPYRIDEVLRAIRRVLDES